MMVYMVTSASEVEKLQIELAGEAVRVQRYIFVGVYSLTDSTSKSHLFTFSNVKGA